MVRYLTKVDIVVYIKYRVSKLSLHAIIFCFLCEYISHYINHLFSLTTLMVLVITQ
uniref:Uncharacterized protein n=1 Tax=Octopus bimaculoides TaxID=37653 RepID=A0A0L8GB85_OCTBM